MPSTTRLVLWQGAAESLRAGVANYDLTSADDVQVLRSLVAEEFAFYANGGLGTELNAVYRPKVTGTALGIAPRG